MEGYTPAGWHGLPATHRQRLVSLAIKPESQGGFTPEMSEAVGQTHLQVILNGVANLAELNVRPITTSNQGQFQRDSRGTQG